MYMLICMIGFYRLFGLKMVNELIKQNDTEFYQMDIEYGSRMLHTTIWESTSVLSTTLEGHMYGVSPICIDAKPVSRQWS